MLRRFLSGTVFLNILQYLLIFVLQIYFFGTQHDHNILVMDLLGPSLDTLLERCGNVFTLKTGMGVLFVIFGMRLIVTLLLVLRLADQIFDIIDTLHRRALIHRDIKPVRLSLSVKVSLTSYLGKFCHGYW